MFFNSKIKLFGKLKQFSEIEVKNEPMLFSCNLDSSYSIGGPITRNFLDLIPNQIKFRKDFIVDSRVHMLMPGWYACIPGIHHDDIPRDRSDGQPDYITTKYNSKHMMALVNGDICPTRFYLGECYLDDVPIGEKYYKTWHPIIRRMGQENKLHIYDAESNRLIQFDNHTWHEGTKCIKNGFRWFIRASWNTEREFKNEIRKNANVYLEVPTEGW